MKKPDICSDTFSTVCDGNVYILIVLHPLHYEHFNWVYDDDAFLVFGMGNWSKVNLGDWM